MRFSCGPPRRAGAYTKWNWCAMCTRIWDKTYKRCTECNQMFRTSAKKDRGH